MDFRELSSSGSGGAKSATIRERVVAMRKIQSERFRKSANATNTAHWTASCFPERQLQERRNPVLIVGGHRPDSHPTTGFSDR